MKAPQIHNHSAAMLQECVRTHRQQPGNSWASWGGLGSKSMGRKESITPSRAHQGKGYSPLGILLLGWQSSCSLQAGFARAPAACAAAPVEVAGWLQAKCHTHRRTSKGAARCSQTEMRPNSLPAAVPEVPSQTNCLSSVYSSYQAQWLSRKADMRTKQRDCTAFTCDACVAIPFLNK